MSVNACYNIHFFACNSKSCNQCCCAWHYVLYPICSKMNDSCFLLIPIVWALPTAINLSIINTSIATLFHRFHFGSTFNHFLSRNNMRNRLKKTGILCRVKMNFALPDLIMGSIEPPTWLIKCLNRAFFCVLWITK